MCQWAIAFRYRQASYLSLTARPWTGRTIAATTEELELQHSALVWPWQVRWLRNKRKHYIWRRTRAGRSQMWKLCTGHTLGKLGDTAMKKTFSVQDMLFATVKEAKKISKIKSVRIKYWKHLTISFSPQIRTYKSGQNIEKQVEKGSWKCRKA